MKNNKTGQKLWVKAKKIIPGGNQLLSKRSEIFLPNLWPSYYKKAKGFRICDLDNNWFNDFAGMGVTSCILGYCDSYVDNAVIKAIRNASITTLNSYEEYQLAEKLISLHPWSDMVKFAKTGGEACTIAVRIARAASGKDKVLFCGYHGWHDWYLSANIKNKNNLNKQLLTGLQTNGVPSNLKNSTIPFLYNKNSFDHEITKYGKDIGVIIMEPTRGCMPPKGFLQHIKKTAKRIGAVLIFDEITTGFHENIGGIHLNLKVNPDIAIFSKAMGNGYPIAAVIGKKHIMNYAQDSFISSTMWTERIGFVASLASIKKMEKFKIQKHLIKYGLNLKNGWKRIAKESKINIIVSGIDSIPNFKFNNENSLVYSTFFIQEMLKKGFLANNSLATTFAYNDKIINRYLDAAYDVFNKIQILEEKEVKIESLLQGPIKHSTFQRLND